MPSITSLAAVYYNFFINNIFGSLIVADLFFIGVLVYWGLNHNWSVDSFAVVLIPAFTFVGLVGLPFNFKVIIAIVGGLLMAYEMYRLAT